MDRRSFLKTGTIGAGAAGATALAAPAYAQGNRTLTMVTTWGRGLAGVHDSAQYCADKITAMSDGQLTVDLRAAGELVGAFESFDAVVSGQADMYHAADYYFTGQHPAYQFFTSLPFGMTSLELNNWYYHGGGQALHDELGQVFGLKPFLAGNTGAQAGGWFRNEIGTPEDFQGLKIRAPGQSGEVFAKLGASVQNIPGAEVYQAFSSGALDAVDWIGPWADETAGFQEITKLYYTAGSGEPGPGITLATNLDVWESLSPAHQAIVEQTATASNLWTWSLFVSRNAAALNRLQQAGVQALTFPDEVYAALAQASQEVYQGYMGDELYKKIFDSYQASMRENAAWIGTSEGAYVTQRNRLLDI